MRRSHRLISLAVLLALSSGLAGCGSLGGWDPTDMFDFLDNKKKLAGERKPVFPEGVPGLEQGVPKSLYKGAQQDQAAVDAAPAPPPVEEAKPKRSRSHRNSAAARPAPQAEPAPEEDGSTAAAPPAPKPAKQARRRSTTVPAADQPAAESAPAQQQQGTSAFPAPMPSGSFQR
ncbi:hypothetical protein [Rhodopseudomonas sp.]|uniref:hypothetical protein n=1 Tax=Rhodopseudomonas sp. TaxID=1078 RepID=UPI003B3BA474